MCAPHTQKKERQASIFSYFIDRVHIKKDCFSRSLIQSLSLSLTHSDRACFLRTTVPYSHWLLSFSFPTFQDTTSSPSTLSLSLSLCCAIESPPRGRQALLLYQFSMVSFFTSRFVFLFPPVTSFLYPISNGFQSVASPHRQYLLCHSFIIVSGPLTPAASQNLFSHCKLFVSLRGIFRPPFSRISPNHLDF